MLKTLRVRYLLAANGLLLLAVLLVRASQGSAIAPVPAVPRQVEIQEISTGKDGSVLTHHALATRSDGATSMTSTIIGSDGAAAERQRYLTFPDGRRVIADMLANNKMTTKMTPEQLRGAASKRLSTASKCQKYADGSDIRETLGGLDVLGDGEYMGFAVTKVRMRNPNIEMWYAPALGCEIVYQVAPYDGGTSIKSLKAARVREPDASLFAGTDNMQEVPPSAFVAAIGTRCNRPVNLAHFAEEDRRYYASRP